MKSTTINQRRPSARARRLVWLNRCTKSVGQLLVALRQPASKSTAQ